MFWVRERAVDFKEPVDATTMATVAQVIPPIRNFLEETNTLRVSSEPVDSNGMKQAGKIFFEFLQLSSIPQNQINTSLIQYKDTTHLECEINTNIEPPIAIFRKVHVFLKIDNSTVPPTEETFIRKSPISLTDQPLGNDAAHQLKEVYSILASVLFGFILPKISK